MRKETIYRIIDEELKMIGKVSYSDIKNSLVLSEKEATIILMRKAGATLEEVGKEFHITRERVRVIETNIQEKLGNVEKFKSNIADRIIKRINSNFN